MDGTILIMFTMVDGGTLGDMDTIAHRGDINWGMQPIMDPEAPGLDELGSLRGAAVELVRRISHPVVVAQLKIVADEPASWPEAERVQVL